MYFAQVQGFVAEINKDFEFRTKRLNMFSWILCPLCFIQKYRCKLNWTTINLRLNNSLKQKLQIL
jgi:hypothetical protein